MRTNIHWFHDAARSAERKGEGRRAIDFKLEITVDGIRIRAMPKRTDIRPNPTNRGVETIVTWEQMATKKFNPLLEAIDRAEAAINGAEDAAIRQWSGDPDVV